MNNVNARVISIPVCASIPHATPFPCLPLLHPPRQRWNHKQREHVLQIYLCQDPRPAPRRPRCSPRARPSPQPSSTQSRPSPKPRHTQSRPSPPSSIQSSPQPRHCPDPNPYQTPHPIPDPNLPDPIRIPLTLHLSPNLNPFQTVKLSKLDSRHNAICFDSQSLNL